MKYHIILFLLLLTYTGAAAQSPARTGKDYAVFFYVTDFQPGLKDLPDTQTEARDLAKELTDNYGFACSFVPECTKNQIQNELKTWNQRLKPGDQVLFFFSTHGYYDRDSDRGYLIPSDGHADDQNNYFTSWLSYDDLRTYLAPCKAGHLLVALDACYSGAFGIRSNRKPDDPAYNESVDCAAKIGQAMQYKGRQFITAGKVTEATPGKSAFAAEILKTLRTGFNEDGMVLIDDLAYRLHKLKSPEPEDGTFVGHQPGGDFVFVRKNACILKNLKSKPLEDLSAWVSADSAKNYQRYIDKWCPGGAFCEAAEAKLALSRIKANTKYTGYSLNNGRKGKTSLHINEINFLDSSLIAHISWTEGLYGEGNLTGELNNKYNLHLNGPIQSERTCSWIVRISAKFSVDYKKLTGQYFLVSTCKPKWSDQKGEFELLLEEK